MTVICLGAQFKCLKIEKWTFSGSADFLKLVEDATEKLRNYDPEILRQMTDQFSVINFGDKVSSAPAWRLGYIPDAYVAWGGDGVLAVWIYFLFHSLAYRGNRWSMSVTENSIAAASQARKRAALWLMAHEFPDELCRSIGRSERDGKP
jgi:hypothetical protein